MDTNPSQHGARAVSRLTARQRQVLALVAEGRTNAEIGEALGIGFETAKMHVGDILARLGVDSREDAARLWRSQQTAGARLRRALGILPAVPARAAGFAVGLGAVAVAAAVVFALLRSDNRAEVPPAAPVATQTTAPSVELIGTRWDLVTIDGQQAVSYESAAYLLLRDEPWEDGFHGGGYSGCNGFGGEYSVEGRRIRFGGMFQHARGCGGLADNVEEPFISALHSGPLVLEQSGDRLALVTAQGMRLEFVARTDGDPARTLTLHRWALTNLDGRGEGAFRSIVFDFKANGKFSTTTACGELRGGYEHAGMEMRIVVDGETPANCAEPDKVFDAQLRAALSRTTTYLVDLTVLSLLDAEQGGVGLAIVEP